MRDRPHRRESGVPACPRRLLLLALSLLLSALLSTPGPAATLRVPAGHTTIQAALDAAANGDTVLIAPGIYTGNGNRDLTPRGKTLTIRSELGPEHTIIDCEADFYSPHRGFLYTAGESSESRLEGLTIRNGFSSRLAPPARGGGILCTSGSPAISNCWIVGNSSYDGSHDPAFGGGISVSGASSASIRDCLFVNNLTEAGGGGAVFNAGLVERCEFVGNQASFGGGLSIGYGAMLSHCRFEGNRAAAGGALVMGGGLIEDCVFLRNAAKALFSQTKGGAAYLFATTVLVRNCTFYANESTDLGSSLYLAGTTLEMESSILAFNASGDGRVIACEEAALASLGCCDVFGNVGGDWLGCIEGQETLEGNFSADPKFCSPSLGDLALFASSPCLPGQHPQGVNCGRIGALEMGCSDPTTVEAESWGGLKALFRSQ